MKNDDGLCERCGCLPDSYTERLETVSLTREVKSFGGFVAVPVWRKLVCPTCIRALEEA